MLSRRSFLWLTGAAGLSTATLSAQRGRGGESIVHRLRLRVTSSVISRQCGMPSNFNLPSRF